MNFSLRPFAVVLALTTSIAAFAQSDEAIPYGDDEQPEPAKVEPPPRRTLPKRSEPKSTEDNSPKSRRGKRGREEAASKPETTDDVPLTPSTRSKPATSSTSRDADEKDTEALSYGDETDAIPEVTKKEPTRSYSGLDDPNTGVGLQLFGGLMLGDSSRGAIADSHLAFGARFNWEFGRTIFSEPDLRDALFADVTWAYTPYRDGTRQVFGDANVHYFSLAPAWTLFFDGAKSFGVYAQLGGGIAYQSNSVTVGTAATPVSAVLPLFQYGLGFRGRPLLGEGTPLRLAFRVEVTRFRRGYLNDTMIAGSLGGAF